MPFPIVPVVIGAGLAALVAAGKAEQAKAPSAGVSNAGTATPTTQSTGGTNGGAQAPSHNDQNATSSTFGELPPLSSAPLSVGSHLIKTGVDAYVAPTTPTGSSPVETGQESAFTGSDPWAPAPGPSITSKNPDISGALGSTAGMTTRAVTDTFQTLGSTFGGIW